MSKPIESGAVDRRIPTRLEFDRLVDRVERLSKVQDLLVGEVRRQQEDIELIKDALEHPEPGARLNINVKPSVWTPGGAGEVC